MWWETKWDVAILGPILMHRREGNAWMTEAQNEQPWFQMFFQVLSQVFGRIYTYIHFLFLDRSGFKMHQISQGLKNFMATFIFDYPFHKLPFLHCLIIMLFLYSTLALTRLETTSFIDLHTHSTIPAPPPTRHTPHTHTHAYVCAHLRLLQV